MTGEEKRRGRGGGGGEGERRGREKGRGEKDTVSKISATLLSRLLTDTCLIFHIYVCSKTEYKINF